jgi:hypothetical protein
MLAGGRHKMTEDVTTGNAPATGGNDRVAAPGAALVDNAITVDS